MGIFMHEDHTALLRAVLLFPMLFGQILQDYPCEPAKLYVLTSKGNHTDDCRLKDLISSYFEDCPMSARDLYGLIKGKIRVAHELQILCKVQEVGTCTSYTSWVGFTH